jgi:stage III sporulation protein AE
MEKFVLWGMKTVVAGMTGVQILKNMLAPAMDTLKRSALGKAAEAIPGIGSAIGGAAQVLLASAVLIRNCMGIVILLVLVVGSLSPLLHMALKCGVLYVLSAVGQPVADRRMLGCIRSVARGYGMYVRVLSGTLVLFFLAVALMAQTE